MEDLPYRVEYAKSDRSNCRTCKSNISKGSLRIAVMVQSFRHDGKDPFWHHERCFWTKQRPNSTDEIYKFETLRIEDQQLIEDKIKNSTGIVVPQEKKKGKKRAAAADLGPTKDFLIEYAKSSRSTCRGCENKIVKDEIRISKKDYETDVGKRYGGQDMWHHLSCFAKLRSELGWFAAADVLPGFKALTKDDKKEVLLQLPAIKQEQVDVKKMKLEDGAGPSTSQTNGFTAEEAAKYATQNKKMYKIRDSLEKLQTKDLTLLLEYNKQAVPPGRDRILDCLADIMTFGVPEKCPECKNGQFKFEKHGYRCTGDLTEWTKCTNFVKTPARTNFRIPKEMKEEDPFLNKYKSKIEDRIVKEAPPQVKKQEKDEVDSEPKIIRQGPPLQDMSFLIFGKPKRGKDELKKQIVSLGGKVTTKISKELMAVISDEGEVEKLGARMSEIKDANVHVVSEDFVDEAPKFAGKIAELVLEKSICDWGSDPKLRLPVKSALKSKSKSMYTKSVPSKITVTLKGGLAVDPGSGLDHVAHVYTKGDTKYTVVLTNTNIETKKNSYYKIQLLKADKGDSFWVFRAWGRIGTVIGSNKLEKYHCLEEAREAFETVYSDQTGNSWRNHNNFVKIPGRYYPIDIDYSDETDGNMDIVEAESKLPKEIQNLIKLIFDVDAMKKVMKEFELDTEKMPLGKLSKAQIQKAFGVLSELQKLVDEGATNKSRITDASNRFYTFIPHSFGVDAPPLLDTAEIVKQKLEMLDSLMELEIAFNLMKTSVGGEKTVDAYYNQLNTEMDVVDKKSDEFKIIEEYVKNTHASTHGSYALKIVDVFKVKRNGEDKRFKPFKKLPNHKLLWHGSRTTNFAGILSQGLRIAPPEAPVTGYMFGKGIYFADMVSKSANYCCTSDVAPTGLLLLCDVALGNEYELTEAEFIEKLPKGKHSTKGLGRTHPDPKASKQLDGIEVPLGKGVEYKKKSALLYNEYIVYDVAQVNVKYLLRLEFDYKY